MKKLLLVVTAVALALSLLPMRAMASAEYDPVADVWPIHIASYAVYPIGFALEWAIFRPLHAFVSLPYVSTAFGHRVNDGVNRDEYTGHY